MRVRIFPVVKQIVVIVHHQLSLLFCYFTSTATSVTRLGDLLDFGQVSKALGNNWFCPNLPHS